MPACSDIEETSDHPHVPGSSIAAATTRLAAGAAGPEAPVIAMRPLPRVRIVLLGVLCRPSALHGMVLGDSATEWASGRVRAAGFIAGTLFDLLRRGACARTNPACKPVPKSSLSFPGSCSSLTSRRKPAPRLHPVPQSVTVSDSFCGERRSVIWCRRDEHPCKPYAGPDRNNGDASR